jgi:hypothetical protein
MTTHLTLYDAERSLIEAHERLSEALEAETPDNGETQAATSLALAAVEDAMLTAAEKRDAMGVVLRRLESDAAFHAKEAKRMALIAARDEARVERLRTYVLQIMQAHNIEKLKGPSSTFSIQQNPPSVEIGLDAAALPERFQRTIPAQVEADKVAIKAALKADEDVPGCRLKPGGFRLVVR